MEYSWKLTSLSKKDTADLKNIIVQTRWEKIGTNENGTTGRFSGATPFDLTEVDPNNFIPYENLTEEIILKWIQSVVVDSYEEHVNQKITKQIEEEENPISLIEKDFPWDQNNI